MFSRRWGMAAIAFFIFVSTHAYTGIRHDGILYLAQALRHLEPEVFGGDLFFKYGSQDSFSVFGRLYAASIGLLGFEVSSIGGVVLAQLLFLMAAVYWVSKTVPPQAQPISWLLLAVTAGAYGGFNLIHYAEPFLTARSFAEGIVIFSLWPMVKRRYKISLALLILAGLIHPLIASPAALVLFFLKVKDDRRWLCLFILIVPALFLAKFDVPPFGRILQFYDPEWLDMVESYNIVFMSKWPLASWMALAADLLLILLLSIRCERDLGRVFGGVFFVALACLCVSFVGADLFSNAFFASIQLWRIQWLVHLVCISALAVELVKIKYTPIGCLIIALFVYGVVFQNTVSGSLGLILAIILLAYGERLNWKISPLVCFIGLFLLLVSAIYHWHGEARTTIRLAEYLNDGESLSITRLVASYIYQAPMGSIALCVPFLCLLVWSSQCVDRFVPVIVLLFVIASIFSWDRRPEISKLIDRGPIDNEPVFSKFVPKSAEVYWQGEALAPWLLMHRRSYASDIQAAGIVFNRGTAIELRRRLDTTSLLDTQREICGLLGALRGRAGACEPDVFAVQVTCEGDHNLSFIVLSTELAGWALASWSPNLVEKGYSRRRAYFLYECKSLLARMALEDEKSKK